MSSITLVDAQALALLTSRLCGPKSWPILSTPPRLGVPLAAAAGAMVGLAATVGAAVGCAAAAVVGAAGAAGAVVGLAAGAGVGAAGAAGAHAASTPMLATPRSFR